MNQAKLLGMSGEDCARLMSEEAKRALSQDADRSLALFALANNFSSSFSKSNAEELSREGAKSLIPNPRIAVSLYRAALLYDANRGPGFAQTLLASANSRIESQSQTALDLYKVAIEFDRSLMNVAGEKIAQAGRSKLALNDRDALELISAAINYNSSLKPDFADFLTKEAVASLKDENLVRANTLAKAAVGIDQKVNSSIASTWFDKAKGIPPKDVKWEQVVQLARFAQSINAVQAQPWAELLYSIVTQNDKLSLPERINVGRLTVSFDKNQRAPLAKFYLQVAKSELSQRPPSLPSAEDLFKIAVDFDPAAKEQASRLIWSEYERWIFNPIGLGRDRFKQFFALSGEFGVPRQYADGLELYATGLKQQLDGDRTAAVQTFSRLAKSRPKSKEGIAAAEIISLPKPGLRTYSTPAFQMVNSWGNGINMRLVSANVSAQDIELTFNVRSFGNQSYFLTYGVRPETIQNGSCGRPYIMDDLGAKLFAVTGFLGGNQKPMNDFNCAINIEFMPNEETNISIHFPMVSAGAINLTFVSPELFGWHQAWQWNRIPLKSDPFDAPIQIDKSAATAKPASTFASPASSADSQPKVNPSKCFVFNGRQVCQ